MVYYCCSHCGYCFPESCCCSYYYCSGLGSTSPDLRWYAVTDICRWRKEEKFAQAAIFSILTSMYLLMEHCLCWLGGSDVLMKKRGGPRRTSHQTSLQTQTLAWGLPAGLAWLAGRGPTPGAGPTPTGKLETRKKCPCDACWMCARTNFRGPALRRTHQHYTPGSIT